MSIILDSFSLFCWLNKLPHCRVTELSCSACVSPSSCQCVVRDKASGLEVYYWCSHRLERQEEEEWEEEWSALVCTALLGVSCEFIKLLILSCSTFVTSCILLGCVSSMTETYDTTNEVSRLIIVAVLEHFHLFPSTSELFQQSSFSSLTVSLCQPKCHWISKNMKRAYCVFRPLSALPSSRLLFIEHFQTQKFHADVIFIVIVKRVAVIFHNLIRFIIFITFKYVCKIPAVDQTGRHGSTSVSSQRRWGRSCPYCLDTTA